jgi:hypothetical protein
VTAPVTAPGPRARSLAFDATMTALSGVFVAGLFLDGWAHTHGRVDDTFFTPWHAVLYAGYLITAAYLVATLLRHRVRGHAWRQALPPGYAPSLLGTALWLPTGLGDLAWHEIFGAEANLDALLSPPHLVLALGMGLIVTGPVRAAWRRPDREADGWRERWPLLVSLAYLLSLFTFFIQVAHPATNLWGAGPLPRGRGSASLELETGVVSLLLTSGVSSGVILALLSRFTLPAGALTLVLTLNAAAMGVLYWQRPYPLHHVAGLAAAALTTDGLYRLLQPSRRRVGALRAFAFLQPLAFHAVYFLALWARVGLSWSVHLVTGTLVLAGLLGWLLSYLVAPPQAPRSAHDGV